MKNPTIVDAIDAKSIPKNYQPNTDGFIAKSTGDFGYRGGQYVVFDPKQIKKVPEVSSKTQTDTTVNTIEPVKKPTVTAEDRMNVIKSLKEQIEETTNEIKETRAKAREAVNEIEAKILDTKNENKKEELQFDIVDIETQLEEDLEGLKDDLDRQVAMLKEEVGSLKDLDIKKPENKKTLLSYIDGAIATLNSLNKLTYAKLDAGVTLGTLKLILQGIRAGVVAGKAFDTAIRAMAIKYKKYHDNKKITIDEFIKEINDYLSKNEYLEEDETNFLNAVFDKSKSEAKKSEKMFGPQFKQLQGPTLEQQLFKKTLDAGDYSQYIPEESKQK